MNESDPQSSEGGLSGVQEGLSVALGESEAMMAAARVGDWEGLDIHQIRCRVLVEAVCSERGWDAELLERIRGNHGYVMEQVRMARDEAAGRSRTLSEGRRAVRAYGGPSR